MSFALTTRQVRDRTKRVTRRDNWEWLVEACARGEQPLIQPVVKGMGLKKGEKVEKINGPIRILNARREPLQEMIDKPDYGKAECVLEGFPEMDGTGFVSMYCSHNGGTPQKVVTRIEFEYVQGV